MTHVFASYPLFKKVSMDTNINKYVVFENAESFGKKGKIHLFT